MSFCFAFCFVCDINNNVSCFHVSVLWLYHPASILLWFKFFYVLQCWKHVYFVLSGGTYLLSISVLVPRPSVGWLYILWFVDFAVFYVDFKCNSCFHWIRYSVFISKTKVIDEAILLMSRHRIILRSVI